MSILRACLLIARIGVAASLLSSKMQGTVPGRCPNVICERPCLLVAGGGGWPVRYIVDVPGISVEGSVNLFSAIGNSEDVFPVAARLQDVAFWSLVCAVLMWVGAARARCAIGELPGRTAVQGGKRARITKKATSRSG